MSYHNYFFHFPWQVNLNVRPNSMLILHAACEVVKEEGFDELLDNVRARIDEIESLHRTRELTVCGRRSKPLFF